MYRYLSKTEYERLSTSERNQRALDNYVKSRRKSKWQIGRDYELSVGYRFEKEGYNVDYFGSNNGIFDLGRDLIAKKSGKKYIIQCKYWAKGKKIHEKHIFYLFGTLVSYCAENHYQLFSPRIIGVFATNISLSETAKKYASMLNIKVVENLPFEEFPRIKCNINRSESGDKTHIYHLPMDQQYDSVKIEKAGEFLAMTVKEAEDAGFRRAFKWYGD